MNLKIDRLEMLEKLRQTLSQKKTDLVLALEHVEQEKEFKEIKKRNIFSKLKTLDISYLEITDYSNEDGSVNKICFNNLDSSNYNPTIGISFPEFKGNYEKTYKGESVYTLENAISSIEKGIARLEMAKNEFVTVSDKENYFRYL